MVIRASAAFPNPAWYEKGSKLADNTYNPMSAGYRPLQKTVTSIGRLYEYKIRNYWFTSSEIFRYSKYITSYIKVRTIYICREMCGGRERGQCLREFYFLVEASKTGASWSSVSPDAGEDSVAKTYMRRLIKFYAAQLSKWWTIEYVEIFFPTSQWRLVP